MSDDALTRLLRERHDALIREIRQRRNSFRSPWLTTEELETKMKTENEDKEKSNGR